MKWSISDGSCLMWKWFDFNISALINYKYVRCRFSPSCFFPQVTMVGKAVNDLRKRSSKQTSQLAKTLIEYEICVSIHSLLSTLFHYLWWHCWNPWWYAVMASAMLLLKFLSLCLTAFFHFFFLGFMA